MTTKLRGMTERLFQEITGRQLADWVHDRRSDGASWRQVERDLRDAHGIEVSNVTLLAWYGDRDRETAA